MLHYITHRVKLHIHGPLEPLGHDLKRDIAVHSVNDIDLSSVQLGDARGHTSNGGRTDTIIDHLALEIKESFPVSTGYRTRRPDAFSYGM